MAIEIKKIVDEAKKLVCRLKGKEGFENCKFEQIIDEDKRYRIIIYFPNCIGEIMINEPECSPYYLIKFEAVSAVLNIPKMIVSWYAQEGDTLEYIILRLERAINYAVQY